MIAIDTYTKFVLTVIAGCLLWLCLAPVLRPVTVAAQPTERVAIAGWIDQNGNEIRLPARTGIGPAGLPVAGSALPR